MNLLDWLFGALIMEEETADDDWQITASDGEEYGISPFDYVTEEEYENAVIEARMDYEYGNDLDNYEDEVDYDESEDPEDGWRNEVLNIYASEGITDIPLDPYDYDTLDEFIEAFDEYRREVRHQEDKS